MGEGKIRDIRETASDAAEIIRQLGSPEVKESLDKAKEITDTVREITEIMRTPEWVRNIENISKMVEKLPDFSGTSGESAFGDVRGLVQSTKKVMDNLASEKDGLRGQDLQELVLAFKDMLQSFKILADELTAVAAESKRSGSLRNAKAASSSISSAYRMATGSH